MLAWGKGFEFDRADIEGFVGAAVGDFGDGDFESGDAEFVAGNHVAFAWSGGEHNAAVISGRNVIDPEGAVFGELDEELAVCFLRSAAFFGGANCFSNLVIFAEFFEVLLAFEFAKSKHRLRPRAVGFKCTRLLGPVYFLGFGADDFADDGPAGTAEGDFCFFAGFKGDACFVAKSEWAADLRFCDLFERNCLFARRNAFDEEVAAVVGFAGDEELDRGNLAEVEKVVGNHNLVIGGCLCADEDLAGDAGPGLKGDFEFVGLIRWRMGFR